MLREPYTEKFYTYHSKYINNRLALRPPQGESLERFAKIVDLLSLSKTPDLADELALRSKYHARHRLLIQNAGLGG